MDDHWHLVIADAIGQSGLPGFVEAVKARAENFSIGREGLDVPIEVQHAIESLIDAAASLRRAAMKAPADRELMTMLYWKAFRLSVETWSVVTERPAPYPWRTAWADAHETKAQRAASVAEYNAGLVEQEAKLRAMLAEIEARQCSG